MNTERVPLVTPGMQNGIPAECVPEDVLWCEESYRWHAVVSDSSEEWSETTGSCFGENDYSLGHVACYPCVTAGLLYTQEWEKILEVAGIAIEDLDRDLELKMRVIRWLHQINVDISMEWGEYYLIFTHWNNDLEDHPVWEDMGNRLREKEEDWRRTKDQEKLIFCDLDGVLSDFAAGAELVWSRLQTRPIRSNKKWQALANHPNFFGKLPWMIDGKELWNAIGPKNPTILTGVPHGNWAAPQKRHWVRNELGLGVPIITCFSNAKHKHCPRHIPGAILIDDNRDRKDAWEAMGGTFIHHLNSKDTIKRLLTLGVRIDAL